MNSDGTYQNWLVDPGGTSQIYANGWSPDSLWVTYTYIHLINYGGTWYWDYAYLYKYDPITGGSYQLNPGRDTDWNVDWTTTDAIPPSTGMNALASPVPYQFTVSWWGVDNGPAGLLNFDVQVRDGSGGTWTDWQMSTEATSATFTGLGGHDYYFRLRGRDQAYNLQPWPAGYNVVTRVENFAPVTRVEPLDALIRGTSVTVNWDGYDLGGSGINGFDIQYKDGAGGIWQNWLTNTPAHSGVFAGQTGHTYYFRSRGTDNAMNVEAWPPGDGDTTTTFFSWQTFGTVRDNTDVPIAGVDVDVDPPAFLTYPSDVNGNYSAYLASNPEVKTITWSKSSYGAYPPTSYYGTQDVNVDVYLPPADNIVQDWGFESGNLPGAWQAGGEYTPSLTTTVYHSGDYASWFGPQQTFSTTHELEVPGMNINTSNITQTGVAWLSQSLTVPVSMTNPVLSFLVSLSGVSDISGNEFRLTVSTDLTDTTSLYTSTTPTNWEHVWFDMTPWSGQAITLTFELSETAGYPPASALLDEVTLGSAHADTWVSLSGSALGAHPGDQITFQLDYGNRGGAMAAASAITLTLPSGLNFVDASIPPVIVGDQLVWQVGDLPAGSDPYSISLTVEVDAAAPLGDTVITSAEITTASPELERLNNSAQVETFLGYLALLPIIHR